MVEASNGKAFWQADYRRRKLSNLFIQKEVLLAMTDRMSEEDDLYIPEMMEYEFMLRDDGDTIVYSRKAGEDDWRAPQIFPSRRITVWCSDRKAFEVYRRTLNQNSQLRAALAEVKEAVRWLQKQGFKTGGGHGDPGWTMLEYLDYCHRKSSDKKHAAVLLRVMEGK